MDKFDEQATNLLIDLGVQIAGKTKELEALRDRIGQFGREVDREAREEERALLLATIDEEIKADMDSGSGLRSSCPGCCADFIANGQAVAGELCPSCAARAGSGQQVREGFEILEGLFVRPPREEAAGSGHECAALRRIEAWLALNENLPNRNISEHGGTFVSLFDVRDIAMRLRAALTQPCPAPLIEPQVFVESQNAVTEMRQHLAAVFECREELMRAVAGFDWGTSVSESYHNERMAAMDRLREAVK